MSFSPRVKKLAKINNIHEYDLFIAGCIMDLKEDMKDNWPLNLGSYFDTKMDMLEKLLPNVYTILSRHQLARLPRCAYSELKLNKRLKLKGMVAAYVGSLKSQEDREPDELPMKKVGSLLIILMMEA